MMMHVVVCIYLSIHSNLTDPSHF